MSDVEKLYIALAPHFGATLKWQELNVMEQETFINGINQILAIMLNARHAV